MDAEAREMLMTAAWRRLLCAVVVRALKDIRCRHGHRDEATAWLASEDTAEEYLAAKRRSND